MYEVMLNDRTAGHVTLQRQGAYYLLTCECDLHMTQRHHLILMIDDKETDLGLCLPNETGLELRTRIKASWIGDSIPRFVLVKHDPMDNGCTFTVKPNEPFDEISRIQYGRLSIQNGAYRITFPLVDLLRSPIQQDSDQSRELASK